MGTQNVPMRRPGETGTRRTETLRSPRGSRPRSDGDGGGSRAAPRVDRFNSSARSRHATSMKTTTPIGIPQVTRRTSMR